MLQVRCRPEKHSCLPASPHIVAPFLLGCTTDFVGLSISPAFLLFSSLFSSHTPSHTKNIGNDLFDREYYSYRKKKKKKRVREKSNLLRRHETQCLV